MFPYHNHTHIGYLTAPVLQTRANSYKYFVPDGTTLIPVGTEFPSYKLV